MTTFTTRTRPFPRESHFAVGLNTGSLFLMIGPDQGRIIIGYGHLAGREGQLHWASEQLFRRLPYGTILEISI